MKLLKGLIQPFSPSSVLLLSFNTSLCTTSVYTRMQERRDDDLTFLSCLMSRLTTSLRSANSGLKVWGSKKYCPCWLCMQVHRTECIWQLGCISFAQFCWRKRGSQKALQCPSFPCSPESLLHIKSLPACWRTDLCTTKPVHVYVSDTTIHSSWAALQQDHGSAVLGMHGGKQDVLGQVSSNCVPRLLPGNQIQQLI